MRVRIVAVALLVAFFIFVMCGSANDAALSHIFVDADHNGIPDIKDAQLGRRPNFEAAGVAVPLALTAPTAAAAAVSFPDDDDGVVTEPDVEHDQKFDVSFKILQKVAKKAPHFRGEMN
ncbi:MAG TPA: hypothetical protein ENF26_07020 [Methanomicrobia archaeon]|nr:hypothetical protein [Methanomicrobia archaeon]HEX59878.1 hypothetical protein [Methanomicrobia archaeon]